MSQIERELSFTEIVELIPDLIVTADTHLFLTRGERCKIAEVLYEKCRIIKEVEQC